MSIRERMADEPGGSPISRRQFVGGTARALSAVAAASLVSGCVVFQVDLVMAVQSIQDFAGSVPLIAGKRTIVRVFPVTLDEPGAVITGEMQVFSGSRLLGNAVLRHTNISSHPRDAIDPDESSHSVDFEIPLAFITGDPLTVRWTLRSGGADPYEDTRSTELTFMRVPRADRRLRPVLVSTTGYASTTPTREVFASLLDGVLGRFPISMSHYVALPPRSWTTDRAMTSGGDFVWLLTDLATTFLGSDDYPAAIVSPPSPLPGTLGATTRDSGGAIVAFAPRAGVFSLALAEVAFSHEFGHRYGLDHAAGCGMPADVDPTLPMLTDLTGMDVRTDEVQAQGSSELMTYCALPTWLSSTTYTRILDAVT
jgi:hypothetical protein